MPELEDWLVQVRQDLAYHDGTVVPVVGLRLSQRSSGPFVVGDAPTTAPLEQMAVYLTASEVFGEHLPPGFVDEFLGAASADALVWATAMLFGRSMKGRRDGGRTRRCDLRRRRP